MKKTPSLRAPKKAVRISATIALGTAALMALGLASASAHVSVDASSTSANSYSLLTFSVPHGCDGSATTKIAISLPESIDDATPTVNPNWTVAKVTEKLAQPKTLENGSKVTERTSQIVYTAKTPLDPELRDTLVLSLQLPDGSGTQLNFPVLQSCVKGQTNWATVVPAGQDDEAVQDPAPAITLTAATDPASANPANASGTTESKADDGGSQLPGWLGLAAGVLGLLLGGFALFRTRKQGS
ncbi:uncharacterized protein YcnI [Psychromicrobium silvestre]|uniref:Uncharacterized protein YcnI n=1 Tax=Psychromicrobium silvestre TaxID=1645614 RepID=A0A7Y9LUH6_9MICC|nr:YcnI family protein [Psychromicrobium silvestre]NYE95831.1 uncharacterized protein YcnI [Psychromicrobium silvestre]